MAAAAAEATTDVTGAAAIRDSLAELERQQELLASCTRLYQQLTEHLGSLERGIKSRSDSLSARRRVVEFRASCSLNALRPRELSLDGSRIESLTNKRERDGGVAEDLGALCASMDSAGFLSFVVERRKEVGALCAELPAALIVDAVSAVFPVDRRAMRSPTDLA